MMTLSFFLGMALLCCTGYSIARHVLPPDRSLHVAIALPLGACVHTFVLLVLTLIGVPILWWSVLPLHGVVCGAFLLWPVRSFVVHQSAEPFVFPPKIVRVLSSVCVTLLVAQCLFVFTHAVLLPTYHIDSLTNWTMRAKVSWLDHELAFDETEVRGVAKPQYPFLVHGVQMMAHIVAPAWSDRSANVSTLLLTFSGCAALFLILRRLRGAVMAMVILTCLTSIPLLSFHLAQGYGDIHLVIFLSLACACTLAARIECAPRWLWAASLLIVAVSWTKTEGIIVGLLPWLVLMGIDACSVQVRRPIMLPMLLAAALSLLLPAFLWINGLPFTPHASDAALALHLEAIGPMLSGLFLSPSMGLTWWAIGITLGIAMMFWKRGDHRIDCRTIIVLVWGMLALLIVLATYTLTPNVRFLINGESYFRQLMVPAVLFIVALGGAFQSAPRTPPVIDE